MGSNAVTTIEVESHSISYHTMATMVKRNVLYWSSLALSHDLVAAILTV